MYSLHSLAMFLSATVIVVLMASYILMTRFRGRQQARDSEANRPDGFDEKEKPYTDGSASSATRQPQPLPARLPSSVTASDRDTIGRDQWVLRMTRHVFNERHGGRYNVLVINDHLEYQFTPEGMVEELHVVYKDAFRTVPYRVVVFAKGELINLGDGGDINWDWMGNFVRLNNTQLSFSPCRVGVQYQQDAWKPTAKE